MSRQTGGLMLGGAISSHRSAIVAIVSIGTGGIRSSCSASSGDKPVSISRTIPFTGSISTGGAPSPTKPGSSPMAMVSNA